MFQEKKESYGNFHKQLGVAILEKLGV